MCLCFYLTFELAIQTSVSEAHFRNVHLPHFRSSTPPIGFHTSQLATRELAGQCSTRVCRVMVTGAVPRDPSLVQSDLYVLRRSTQSVAGGAGPISDACKGPYLVNRVFPR